MKLVIDISEETYNEIMDDAENTPRNLSHYERIIAKGTPLPKGHGKLIGEKNISKGFEDFVIKVLREQKQAESEDKE